MDSQELTSEPLAGGSSAQLEALNSNVVDATVSELPLFIPGGGFVLLASYERFGPDLLLFGEEYSVLVRGYFTREHAPDLYTTDGSSFVSGSDVTRLAGPATPEEFAQAGEIPSETRIVVAESDEAAPLQTLAEVESSEGDNTDVIAAVTDAVNLISLADLDVIERIPKPIEPGPGVWGAFVEVADKIFQLALREGVSSQEAEFRVQQMIREALGEGVLSSDGPLLQEDSIQVGSGTEGNVSLEEEGLNVYEQAVKEWFRFSGEYDELKLVNVDFQPDIVPLRFVGTPNGYVPELAEEQTDSRGDEFIPLLPTVVDFNYDQTQNFEVAESAGTISFTVTRGGRIDLTSTVDFATSDGTATAGEDYTATSGTLTFAPGEITKEVRVSILDDAFDETGETFFLTVSNPSNASILGGSATATIIDDDNTPSLSINDVTTTDESAANATFTATLSAASGQTVTVDYESSNGTATAGADYTITSGTLTFAAGETTQTFTVPVLADTTDESNETATLTLSNASNASINDATGTLTITDDDSAPSLSIDDVATDNENAANATFTVTLSAASGQTVTVDYASSNGTATEGVDYTETSGTLTFAAGETTKTFNVPILADSTDEDNETATLTLSNATNASISDATGILTITDDDGAPAFTIDDVTTDGESAANATFTVTRAGDTTGETTVDFASSDGTATAGADYTETNGTLTFAAGVTTQTFNVAVLADTTDESNETATLTLSNASAGSISDATGILTITDDDNDGDPTVSSFSPADNEYSVTASDNVVITFSEAVFDDGGLIRLFKKQGDIEVTSDVTISGTTVTINPSSDLSENTGYYVKISSGALVDEAGNSFAGLTNEGALNFTTAVFDGLEDGVNLNPTTDLLHVNYKSVSIFTTPLEVGQSITYDPNDGLGNWFYFYEGTSALSGDIGVGLFNFLDAQGTTVVNGIPKPDVGITWVSGGQDDNDGNTATNPQLFRHVNLTTFKANGDERVDWDVGKDSTNTRLVRWEYTSDGFLEGYDLRDDPEFVRAKSDVAFTPEAGNTGFLYLAFANKNSAEHDTPMTYSVAAIVDGVVEGLEYFTTSGLTGLTDENGQFRYLNGDDITFKVGGVVLGTATAEDVVSGKTFLQDIADVDRTDLNDEYLKNMATFLQSLDENHHPDDGIVITDATRMALQGTTLDLRTATEEEVQTLVENIGARYVNEMDAMKHVKDMLVKYTGLQGGDFEEHVSDDITAGIFDYVAMTPDVAASGNWFAIVVGPGSGTIEELMNATSGTSTAFPPGSAWFLAESDDTQYSDDEVVSENYMLLTDLEATNAVAM